jgi:hypothetical protein
LLEESERECEAALTVDAQDAGVRSCGVAFLLHGDFGRAQDYFRLDLGSEWEKALSMDLLLREGKTKEAWDARPPTVPQWGAYGVLLAHLQHRPASEIVELARMVKPNEDAEVNYFSAAHLAYAGRIDAALTLLQAAIEGGYCSWPLIDSDPLLANVRGRAEFAEIRSRAMACNRSFLSGTNQE